MSRKQQDLETKICKFIGHDESPSFLYDIGVGSKSEYLSLQEKYPEMLLMGLEPCPITFAKLIPVFPGILLPYGVWSEEKCLDLYFSKLDPDAANVYAIRREETVKIYAKTLDSIDKNLRYPNNILLWMDVEGSELNALKGSENLLKSGRVKWINIAVRNKWSADIKASIRDEIHELLIQFGYKEKLQYNHHNRESEFWRCDAIYVK